MQPEPVSLATRHASLPVCGVSFMPKHWLCALQDEISTGLDSSTTYLIVRCIKNYVHLLDSTVMMSLLQPAPEVFDLFDDVMLLRLVLLGSVCTQLYMSFLGWVM